MQTRAELTLAAVLVPSALSPGQPIFGRSRSVASCRTPGALQRSPPGTFRRLGGSRFGILLISMEFHDLLGGAGLPRSAGSVRLATVRARRISSAGGRLTTSRPVKCRLRLRPGAAVNVAFRPGPVNLASDVLDAVMHSQSLLRHPDLAAFRLRTVVPTGLVCRLRPSG